MRVQERRRSKRRGLRGRIVDLEDSLSPGELNPGDPSSVTPAAPGDEHALTDLNTGSDAGFDEVAEHVSALAGASGEALGHFLGAVGNLFAAWLQAHSDLD